MKKPTDFYVRRGGRKSSRSATKLVGVAGGGMGRKCEVRSPRIRFGNAKGMLPLGAHGMHGAKEVPVHDGHEKLMIIAIYTA